MKLELKRKFPFITGVQEEALKSLVVGHDPGAFSGKPQLKPKDISTYYDFYENDSVVFAAVNSTAEVASGQGFYTTVDKDEKAKELIDEFCKKQNLDGLLVNITKNMLIAGYCPVETQLNAIPSKCTLRIIHPQTISKMELNKETGELESIEQKVSSNKPISIPSKELAWFPYNMLGNDWRGVSLIKPVVDLLSYKASALKNMDKIIQRYSSPLGIWKSTRDISLIQKTVSETEAGEDIFIGNLSLEELGSMVEYVQIDPRVKFWEYIQYVDVLIYEGLMAPSLGYWRNATQASAEVLKEIVDRNIHSIQRGVKRIVEAAWFTPLCKMNGCSEVPKLEWGYEKTGVEDLDLSMFLAKGLEKGYIREDGYIKLLQNMGIRIEQEEAPPPVSNIVPPEVYGVAEPKVSGAAKPEEKDSEEEN